ncbi:conserved hypothetical protein [Luminiphilus syltensis NOR5-1B]|uniref:Probable inorganic carbon transporter subunit DabA n=1 Tax=Luminiphilus syltensis NOR5-1B TaxID=565045 RepID=B8KXA4_9GAMM|nr:DUF2309 domain-containing protein [Luminiphilus syltensis]EED36588.1 conserved hypothetical protein [Luminiphilus syltensis NOR5-1B]
MSTKNKSNVTVFPGPRAPSPSRIQELINGALQRVAPLWPLDQFVAVNPYQGFSDESFGRAIQRVALTSGGKMVMERRFFLEAYRAGKFNNDDIHAAIGRLNASVTLKNVLDALHTSAQSDATDKTGSAMRTYADVAEEQSGKDWQALITQQVSHWASGYFDAGQAAWPSPFSNLSPFDAWRAETKIDCTPLLMNISEHDDFIDSLPPSPMAACEYAISRLGVHESLLDLYLHRLLMTIGGWVAYARYRGWHDELAGGSPALVLEMLAIRLSWELMLANEYDDAGGQLRWRRHLANGVRQLSSAATSDDQPIIDEILLGAYEYAWQDATVEKIQQPAEQIETNRPKVQAVFCIDVRSEVLRRAIEGINPHIETTGFAGFFGLPIEYVPIGAESGVAHCPVLLKPDVTLHESMNDTSSELTTRLANRVRLKRQLTHGWRAFKNSAVSCFVFVESYGLAYGVKLLAHTLGIGRPEPLPRHRGLSARTARELAPQLLSIADNESGLALERQIEFAESMLRGMSLTKNHARIVLLTGHGSATTNNAHGSGLDCGACGGQSGETNARIGAMILNSPSVRSALNLRGICIPDDTLFIAAVHNTTTDEVTLFDTKAAPETHTQEIVDLQETLDKASEASRQERSVLLGVAPKKSSSRKQMARKSADWSDVRPEWGLAGCAGFIAAPRAMTRSKNLEGRAFLHSYDYRDDPDFSVLELIMTAPMVVASWINLQYYGSTVDNRVFGSGDKTLHNVVGHSIGVLEGNGGDLRVGLSKQSVHDGQRYIHEPMRLSVFIAAPIVAINTIIERHENIKNLVDNGWLNLFALYEDGDIVARYRGNLEWESHSEHDMKQQNKG